MLKVDQIKEFDDEKKLKYMLMFLKSQLSSENNWLSNISNASAIIMSCVDRLNWAGFYFYKDGELLLGPFQGKPACNRIKIGSGVCGTAFEKAETILVDNVNEFPGHIFCDGDSKSELVVPIIVREKVLGVLDLDSPEYSRFTDLEKTYFEEFVAVLERDCIWE